MVHCHFLPLILMDEELIRWNWSSFLHKPGECFCNMIRNIPLWVLGVFERPTGDKSSLLVDKLKLSITKCNQVRVDPIPGWTAYIFTYEMKKNIINKPVWFTVIKRKQIPDRTLVLHINGKLVKYLAKDHRLPCIVANIVIEQKIMAMSSLGLFT